MSEQRGRDKSASRDVLLLAASNSDIGISISSGRCGVVLAGGDGRRLQAFIRRFRGDVLPKQYVNFVGRRSMLEHTFHRAERLIPAERLFTVASRDHVRHPEVRRQLAARPDGTVILQPENRETGPGLLLPLTYLRARFGDGVVTVFPADHCILDEVAFMERVEIACRVVEQDPSQIVLLGVEPDRPEPEYGYVLPDPSEAVCAISGARPLSCFVEKPPPDLARDLVRRGGLWNTLVMVFQISTFLGLVREVTPGVSRAFERIGEAIGTPREAEVVESSYRTMQCVNLSRDVLEVLGWRRPSPLRVLPVKDVGWSDWGSEERITNVLSRKAYANVRHAQPSAANAPGV